MKIVDLIYWLKPKEKLFLDFEKYVLDFDSPDKHRIFINRNSNILFVAHLDTVQKPKYIRQRKTKSGKQKRIYACGLDDRLGCMIAFNLSEKLNADLLLCDNEESMNSTAQYHNCKNYNWIAEFDRAGSDVVTYDLDCVEFRQAISKYWKIGLGLFSDIAQLNTQACCMNVGIGYEFAHSKDSYVCVKTMLQQIEKFIKFFNQYKDVKFIQNCQEKYDYLPQYNFDECEICGEIENSYIYGHNICRECFTDMLQQYCYDWI